MYDVDTLKLGPQTYVVRNDENITYPILQEIYSLVFCKVSSQIFVIYTI